MRYCWPPTCPVFNKPPLSPHGLKRSIALQCGHHRHKARTPYIGEEGTMLQSLALAAIVVVILWVIILGLYLLVARRQPDVAAQMKALDEQLQRTERESERK
jgi:hypothetical protein